MRSPHAGLNDMNATREHHRQRTARSPVPRPPSMDQRSRIWQTIAEHEPVAETLPLIHGILKEMTALGGLRIDGLDTDQTRLDTVAAAGDMASIAVRLEPTDSRALNASFERHSYYVVPAGTSEGPLSVFGPATTTWQRLILKLPTTGAIGFAIVDIPMDWDESDIAAFIPALTPLASALDNQHRLAELERLRANAEADRQSLLQRLGRQTLSDRIVGENSGLRDTMRQANAVAGSDTTVLLLGATGTGTGKEVIARSIHDRSPRAKAPFIRVNCGAIPAELIDSELFGHEKGSFTGAISRRRGWFERADGGTLFLDEIAELPMPAQVRLLRVLQDHRFQRVGGEREIVSDVRIVAATHRDLDAMVSRGEFRADLWYRVAIFPIRIPPLTDRADDIPELARHIARRVAHRLGLPEVLPSDHDILLLRNYDWPGNVREMMAVIERAAILGDGRYLAITRALGSDDRTGRPDPNVTSSAALGAESDWPTLDDVMRRHIVTALQHCQGRIYGPQGAARLLDINPNTLRARLRKHGLRASDYRPIGSH